MPPPRLVDAAVGKHLGKQLNAVVRALQCCAPN
jgi:hypothetical protein